MLSGTSILNFDGAQAKMARALEVNSARGTGSLIGFTA